MREIDLVAWRKNIGYVGQDTFLFNSTLRENIALWNETVSLEEIEGAARVAQLDEFVQSLTEGYDTAVGDRGLKLSGGQRQRVAIARAILHRPGVLIFDEATSALDNVTEHAVHMAISQLRTDSVVILVAHRLSTVQDAEQIFVLHEGRVVEKGQHDSLLQARGHYWGLYKGHELEADFATTVDI
jgi:ABC-type multidrug transport system fused ATPase/permease subunit